MARNEATQCEDLRQRVLSVEPFTDGGLSAEFAPAGDVRSIDPDPITDRLIQKIRRVGHISFAREGHLVIWRATSAGLPERGTLTA